METGIISIQGPSCLCASSVPGKESLNRQSESSWFYCRVLAGYSSDDNDYGHGQCWLFKDEDFY